MSFRIKPHERIAYGIRRIARECLDNAITALGDGTDTSDGGVHEARKQFKKVRAVLRLMRDELGRKVFDRENTAVRNAAKPLSEVRDAAALIGRLDELNRRIEGRADAERIAELRRELVRHRMLARARTIGSARTVSAIATSSRAVRRRAKTWRLRRRGWKTIESGVRMAYKRGKRAMGAVRSEPTDAALHEWRKRAKDLRYQLELLNLKRHATRAHQVAEVLGEDHDLAVMSSVVTNTRYGACTSPVLITLIEERRDVLQRRAMAIGAKLYSRKSGAYARRLER